MKVKKNRVIFDTNIWISFLIGKKLSNIKQYIIDGQITIIICSQLFEEIIEVTKREKLRKYFPENEVKELIILLETIAEIIEIESIHFSNRDSKDNFLLDLIDFSKADFLVTGDKDLLIQNPFKTAKIVSPSEFEKEINNN
jgi:putative PIN family toxin of toxin-antitoxin system